MSSEVLLYLLCGWQPLPCCHPPGFPYPQLPTSPICEQCYKQCETDLARIDYALQYAGGWQRGRLLDLRCEAERRRVTWYAAWWVTWPRVGTTAPSETIVAAVPGGGLVTQRSDLSERDRWTGILIGLVGPDAFWRGEIPLPLGAP